MLYNVLQFLLTVCHVRVRLSPSTLYFAGEDRQRRVSLRLFKIRDSGQHCTYHWCRRGWSCTLASPHYHHRGNRCP